MVRPTMIDNLISGMREIVAGVQEEHDALNKEMRNLSVRRTNKVKTMKSSRGALIVFEGLDRVGKSTLAKKLVNHMGRIQRQATYYRFPDRTTRIGSLINEVLKTDQSTKQIDDHAMHLLFSANRWELAQKISDDINMGTSVILDRYAYSGIAYSSAKSTLDLNWCSQTERGLPQPDLVIYLDMPKEAQYKRSGFGEERFETKEMQEAVRIQYQKVMDMSKETWLKINVENKSPDQLLGDIIMPVKRCLESCSQKELDTLEFF